MSIFPTDQRILSGIDTDPQGVDNENPALLDSDEEPHSYLSSFDLMLKLCASICSRWILPWRRATVQGTA